MNNPLKHGIVVCHPAETSFTMAIAQRYAAAVRAHGHETVIRDLYRIGFDPILTNDERLGQPHPDIVAEWQVLGKVDVFVLVYPIWFGAPPAMLKGYIDRVFGAGRTKGDAGSGAGTSILEGKHLVSLTLSGSMVAWLDERGVMGSLRNLFDRYLADVFRLSETHHYHFDGVQPGLPERDYRFQLAEVDQAVAEVLTRIGHMWSKNPNAGDPAMGLGTAVPPKSG
jgi:NAD(P)H dehydrogenase (quinone)